MAYKTLQQLGHTHFALARAGRRHIGQLALELAWPHGTEALLEAMERVRRIAFDRVASDRSACAVALGGSGPYDMIISPGWEDRASFRVFPNLDQGRRVDALDLAAAKALIPLVGDNGMGPDGPEDVIEDIRAGLAVAQELGRPVTACGWCGLYEVVVKPDGSYLLAPMNGDSYEMIDAEETVPA